MSEPPLPELHEAVLDDAALGALANDILALCQVHEVRVRRLGQQRADAAPLALSGALELLRSGGAEAVQVRYSHDRTVWIDTLTRIPTGTRLVRIAAPVSGPA